ncbi:MAG: hypothetical protein NTV07_02050 [Candidatus Omnitrophica bacterium]|nr:hypothetical protein [Candidatus Omnitrophota bacterium]
MGVTEFTVFDPYLDKWPQLKESPFSPESEGYSLVRQTWLKGVNYVYGKRVVKKAKISTENVEADIDPHTSISRDRDALILSMDHPQLVGRYQPPLRRTVRGPDGKPILHRGLSAPKVAARLMAHENKIILDTHYFLSDEDIKEFFALGFDVRALGRGNIGRLKEEAFRDNKFQLKVAHELLSELQALRSEAKGKDAELESAITTIQSKIEYLNASGRKNESDLKQKYEAAKETHSRVFGKQPKDKKAVLDKLVLAEVEPAANKLESRTAELTLLAEAIASQVEKGRCTSPTNPDDMYAHIRRLNYLNGLLQGFLGDCGLAANEMFVSDRPSQPQLPTVSPAAQSQAVATFTDNYLSASLNQFQGINSVFEDAAGVVGTNMHETARAIVTDRPFSHSPLSQLPGAVPDAKLAEASERSMQAFIDMEVGSGNLSPLEARARLFSHQANANNLRKGPQKAAWIVLMELARFGIAPDQARVFMPGQNKVVIGVLSKALTEIGCPEPDTAGPMNAGRNAVILTDSSKGMDVIEFAAAALGREGNLLFDANDALSDEQVKMLLALDWQVAGTGRNDIYGRDLQDIKGNMRRIPGLIDEVTPQNRLEAARQLLTKLQAMPDSAEAVKTVQAKIEYLSAMVELERSPKNLSLKQKLQILRKAYEGARRDQEKKYDVPLGARDTRRALDAAMKNVVSPLENTLTGLLRQAGEVSSALTKQLQEGAMNYTCDDVLTDLARAGDTMFNEEGQTAARDELDRFKKEEKGSRLKLPQAFAPQDLPAKLQKQLRQASIPTGLVRSGKKFMAGERLAAVEDAKKARGESYRDYEAKPFTDKEREPIISTLSDQEATAYQQGRLWHRFTAAGDVKVLPALMMHPGADGKHIEVTQDPEGNLAFTSLRFRGDAKKGKKNNPAEWVKFTLLVPLYIVDVASPKPGEEGKRTFDYFITQQLLRSSIPWKTKQWLVNEVLGKGKILTTIRTDDAVAQNKLAVVMQGNPYADIGAEKEAGGSGRAGYLVSMESAAPEVIVTTDEYGRENLIEIKGVGPMFGERTPGKISQMERTIAGGVKIDKTGKKVSGQTAMRQLYGLVRGPQTGELVVNEGQPAHKEEGATSGVAAAVNHILPWSSNRADIVGQVWRTTPSSKREGSKFIGGKQDYDDAGIGYRLGRQAAEMLSHFGNSANVHIAPGCDNIRMAGVPTRRKTTVEGQSESVIVPNPGEKSYFTDEDSLVNTADERNPFEAFDYYFRWTLVFALTDYEDAKSGSLEKLNYPSIVEWMNGFIDRFLEAPIVRNNPKAVQRFEEIRQMLYSAKDAAAFKQTAELLHAELRDSYVAYRSLRLRLENGFNPTGDSPYTANTGKNFQRGRLTAKGPSRVVGAKGERKPSAEEEARAFIAAERKVLDLAQKAIEEGGYPPLKFDFGMARKELDEKEKMIGHIARQERLVINKFFQVMGWGSFTNRTGYFSQDNITREKQALKVSSDQEALESLINKAYEALMDIGAATPGLLILEDLPSYEQVYNLKKYYLPRAQLKHAKVFIEDTFRGGTAPARMGDGTVWATGLFDKQAAQKLGRTGMEMGKRRVAEVQEGEKIGLETFETKGVQGDMRALVKRNPRSRKVVIYHHGLAGIAADMAIARMNYEISDKASLVTFTSSRLRPLMPGEELNPEAMDRVFGQKGTPQAKTFQDEAEDLRRVVAGTIEYFRGCGVPEDEIEIVLVGKNLGAEAASQVARDFPQIETLMMVGSGLEAFSSSGLPKAQWHDLISRPERGTEEFGQIVANFRAFTGRTILVRALQDLPERQRSMQDLIPLAGGRVELHGVNDEHDMQNEASFAHLAKILSKTIGDDWRFAPGSQQPGTVRIIARDALNAFANWRSVPALRQQLETWYGTDEAMLDAQAKRYLRSITAAIERGFAAQDKEIIIMRVPGKVKTVGNACDYPKGFFDSAAMATMSDNIFVMSERNDDVVNLGTINSQKFPDKQYHLNDGDFGVPPSAEDRFNGQESWDKWIKKDAIKPLWPMKGKDKDSYWFSMVWAATAWGRGAEPAKRANFKGYNFFVGDSNLSSAGGLSSSSNIFIASILGLNYLYDLGWSLEQLATAGYAERYACGTQGGIADHAAILMCMAGQMGILSLSPKTTITGQVTLPKGLNMFIFDSRINREIIAPYVSPRTADYAGSNDPAALFKTSTSQMRAMGNLGSRLGFIYFKNALKNRGVNFNQLGAIVGNGLAAEAKIPNGIKEEEIRGILLSLPARISKQDLLKALQSMINENLLDADTLGVIRGVIETVNAIQFPKDGLALRGLVTYFISGAAKVNEYCKAANAKDIPKIIEVIRAYQNGERLVKFDPTGSTMTFFDGTPTDDQIKTLPLWQLAGIRERSLEPIDRLIDKMEGEVKGIALMVMGQGQGGQIIAYVPEAQVPAFKEALVRNMKEIVSEDLFLSLVKRGFTKQVIGYEDGPTHEYQKGLIDMLINDPAVAARLKALVNESAARPQALDEAVGIFKDNFSPAIEEYSQAGQGASVVMFPAKSQPAQQVQTAATAAAAAAAIGQLGDTVRQLAEAAANV